MLTHMAIASIFGPVLVISGIWTLFYQENVKKVAESLRKTPVQLYTAGILNLIVGLTLINSFNVWSVHLDILVTLLGWVIFIRGLVIYFLPNIVLKMSKIQESAYVLFGLISIIWGLALCWIGFM